MFNLFGAIPDILMGRDPKEALLGNALAVTAAMAAPHAIGMMNGGSTGLLGAADTGLNAAGYLAPEMAAAPEAGLLGAQTATQAAAPVVNMNTQAGMFDTMNAQSNGLIGRGMDAMNTANKVAKPVGQAMQTAQQMAGPAQQMAGPEQPLPPPPQLPSAKMDLSGLLGAGQQQQQYDEQANERRRQMLQMYASRMGGMG